jgi:hypothetical protein
MASVCKQYGGNTAFKTMANLPVLTKSEMITVPLADRNRVFKTILVS